MADNTPSPRPRPVPRPRSASSTHLSTANDGPPPPPIRARSVTSVIPPTPSPRHLTSEPKPHVVRRPSTTEVNSNLDVIERKDALKSAGDVVLRQSVTTSYGVNKAYQRPRSQVKRKTYLEAKLEREEAEKQLEVTRVQAEIAEKEAIALAEKEETEQRERQAQEQVERQQHTAEETHATDTQAHNTTSHDDANGGDDDEDLPPDPENDEELPPHQSKIDHDVSPTINVTDATKEEEVLEPPTTSGDDTNNNNTTNETNHDITNDATARTGRTAPTPTSIDNDGTGSFSSLSNNTGADEGANTSVVVTPPSSVITAALRVKLNLDDAEVSHYERFWATVDKDGDVVTAAGVVPFFKASNLGNKVLRKIWNQCDVDPPHGQLSKDEFMMACKLIALQQAKMEATVDNIATKTDPPTIGHLADPVPLLVNARKPWMTKDATDEQCLAAVQECGPGSWIIQKLGNAEVKLFGNQGGVSKQCQISFGVREGHKCYMTSTGKIFSTLKELADAAKENPSIIKWSDEDKPATMAFDKPVVFSQVVADMTKHTNDDNNTDNNSDNDNEKKHGGANIDNTATASKKIVRKETSESVMTGLMAGFGGDDDDDNNNNHTNDNDNANVEGDGSKGKLASTHAAADAIADADVDVADDGVAKVETPEMKMQRIIAQAEAKIKVAQQKHERAVQEYMNSKLLDEWNAAGRSHKNTKHDKKELKRVLDDPALTNPTVYAAAVVCENYKPKDLKKFYLTIQSGEKVEILECNDTPAGLWVARHPWKSKVLAFVHTRHIMIDAADVQRIHLGTISMASTPATSPTKSPSKQSLSSSISSPPPPTISEDDEGVEGAHTHTNNTKAHTNDTTHTSNETSRHVTLAFADGDRPKVKLAEDATTDQMLNDIYASSEEEDEE